MRGPAFFAYADNYLIDVNLGGFDCAAHVVRKMSFTFAAIAQNLRRIAKLVVRRHQRSKHALRN